MKKYSIVVTPGTVLHRYDHGLYGKVISTSPVDVMRARTGRILKLCGKPLKLLDPTQHNGLNWFRVRNDVHLTDFDVMYENG